MEDDVVPGRFRSCMDEIQESYGDVYQKYKEEHAKNISNVQQNKSFTEVLMCPAAAKVVAGSGMVAARDTSAKGGRPQQQSSVFSDSREGFKDSARPQHQNSVFYGSRGGFKNTSRQDSARPQHQSSVFYVFYGNRGGFKNAPRQDSTRPQHQSSVFYVFYGNRGGFKNVPRQDSARASFQNIALVKAATSKIKLLKKFRHKEALVSVLEEKKVHVLETHMIYLTSIQN
ncbi:hypothetical protein Rs2_22278 [Raphanus sativus]|nr:hypothetical protein Rs2_22278 [Raphanus sativus]